MLRQVHVYGRWGNDLESLMLKNPNAISSRLGSILVTKSLIPGRSYPERHTSLSHLKWQCEASKVAQPAKVFATILTTWVQLLGTHRVGVNCLPQVVLWPPYIYIYICQGIQYLHMNTQIYVKKILNTGKSWVQEKTEDPSSLSNRELRIPAQSPEPILQSLRNHTRKPIYRKGHILNPLWTPVAGFTLSIYNSVLGMSWATP